MSLIIGVPNEQSIPRKQEAKPAKETKTPAKTTKSTTEKK